MQWSRKNVFTMYYYDIPRIIHIMILQIEHPCQNIILCVKFNVLTTFIFTVRLFSNCCEQMKSIISKITIFSR